MRCGLPVVSTDCPVGPREIIEDEVDGRLVRPGDTDGIAAALLELAADDELRRGMGRAALRNSARFDPAYIAERHLDLYQELLWRGPGRRSLGPAREAAHRVRVGAIDTACALRSTARGALEKYGAAGSGGGRRVPG